MNVLIDWILNTAEGAFAARVALVLIGAAIWGNLLLLGSYIPRRAVPFRVAILIVLGVATGGGAVHAGLWGELIYGAVYAVAASAVVLALLLSVVGTPKTLSEQFTEPLDRKGWWADHVLQPMVSMKERVSNWGDLPGTDKPRKPSRRD